MAVDVRLQIEDWRAKLLDLTKRNRLINCKIGARAALEILHPQPKEVWHHLMVTGAPLSFALKSTLVDDHSLTATDDDETSDDPNSLLASSDKAKKKERAVSLEDCLASPRLRTDHLITSLSDEALSTRLKRLSLNAQTSIEEQGVNILFIGFGILEWFEAPQSDIALESPLLLIPINLKRSGPNSPWTLAVEEDEIVANQCLHEMLKADFGLELPEFVGDESDDGADPFQYIEKLQAILDGEPLAKRWRLTPKVILGTFSFQKVAMWQDLGTNCEAIESHGLCRAIAGDPSALPQATTNLPSPDEFDDLIHPKDVHSILDSDSSQLEAILAARQGMSLVVDGPPGTGKSQTIANTIAEFLADGKTVLFVSEKEAALDVVKRRLDDHNLGDFCLECHSRKANKKGIVAELRRSLDLPSEDWHDQEDELSHLHDLRSKLNKYVQALYRKQSCLGITPFQAHGRLASLATSSVAQCQLPDPCKITDGDLRSVCNQLDRLRQCQIVLMQHDNHPWNGATVSAFSFSLQDEIRDSFSSLADSIEAATHNLSIFQQHGLMEPTPNRQSLLKSLAVASEVLGFATFPKEWFAQNPAALCEAFVDLHDSEQELIRLNGTIAEFGLELQKPSLDSLSRILHFQSNDWLARLRTNRATTIRNLRQLLEVVADALAHLRQEVAGLTSAIDSLSRHLTVPIAPTSSIGTLHKLTQIGLVVGEMGPMKSAWFNKDVQIGLFQSEVICRRELAACKEICQVKSRVWTRVAFETVANDICSQAAEFESIVGRLWGRVVGTWARFHSRAKTLYLTCPPRDTRSLLSDMAKLREYHRHMALVRQEEGRWSEASLQDAEGRVNWDAVHSGADAIKRLQSVIKVPDRLKQALSTEAGIDRDAVRTAARAIKARLSGIESQVQSLCQSYLIDKCGENQGTYQELSCGDFSTWLTKAEEATSEFLTEVVKAESCLQPSTDLSLAELPQARSSLLARQEQQSLITTLRAQLTEVPGATTEKIVGIGREQLGPENLEAISRFKQFLAKYGDNPPPSLVAIVISPEIHHDLRHAVDELQVGYSQMQSLWDRVAAVFPTGVKVSTGIVLDETSLADCAVWLRTMVQDVSRLQEWVEFKGIEAGLRQHGLDSLIHEVAVGHLTADNVATAFLKRFYRRWLDEVYALDPVLRDFRIDDHEQTIATFQNSDRRFVRNAHQRIRTRLLDDPKRPHIGLRNVPSSSELGILMRQSTRKRGLMSIRRLFRSIPSVLQRLKPCLMMSPLAVSTFLDSEQLKFDVVIFDEASQVRPFDAIGAIYRGKQLIVAGDEKQLPPTRFFDRLDSQEDVEFSEDSDEIDNNLADFDSILEKCDSLGMPRKRLRWHYRSRRESLIAFSNHHFYGNELVTFPSVLDVDGCSAVRLHHVPKGRWLPGQGKGQGCNPVEAREAALLVVQHFEKYPDLEGDRRRSLGVITFNQRQQAAVDAELEKIRKNRPELEAHFDDSLREKFFVKNLETVQGDERDHIILSVGYGYDMAGKFAMSFGPLNHEGGERRLNVAITRARREVILISSVRADDIDLRKTQKEGPRLLRSYLDFADRGPKAIREEIIDPDEGENESPFEEEVERALDRLGLKIRRQVGCSGFRIDLALVHPERQGRYLLGIECDGATYHSSRTARDRDRLRQEVLEGLGWRICRVWSTDWVRDPERQIKRIMLAYEEELSRFDSGQGLVADSVLPADVKEINEEQPVLRIRDPNEEALVSGSYSSIEDVPNHVLRELISGLLRRVGQTSREQLVKSVARELGFQRTGKKIQERVEATIDNMAVRGDLMNNDEGFLSVG